MAANGWKKRQREIASERLALAYARGDMNQVARLKMVERVNALAKLYEELRNVKQK